MREELGMKEVLLSIAPVSAAETEVEPRRVAEEVLACAAAGAGMVHLHVRDRRGRLTADLSAFQETLRLIRRESDIVIEASTGGVSELTIQERCLPLSLPEVECASLNVGSVNLGRAVYHNPPDDVEYCVGEIIRMGKAPEVEVFEIGMIAVMLELRERFAIPAPLLCSIVLGHAGAAPATAQALVALRSFLPEGVLWGITHYGRREDDILAAAVAMGACTLRVGYEDSCFLGERAVSNVEIVAHYVRLLRAMGKEPMPPKAARSMLHIGE